MDAIAHELKGGVTYFMVADGYAGWEGQVELRLVCAEPEVCDDQVDNDLDGATDCDGTDCPDPCG